MSWGRPMRMSAYCALARGRVQKGHPVNGVRFSAPPCADPSSSRSSPSLVAAPAAQAEVAEADRDDAQRLPRRQHRRADPGAEPRRVRAQRERAVGGGAHDRLPGTGEAARARDRGSTKPDVDRAAGGRAVAARAGRRQGRRRPRRRRRWSTTSSTTLHAELGSRYRVASVQTEADLEAPISDGYDVRLTMRDAVIVRVRKGLKVRRKLGANYEATLVVPTAIGPLASPARLGGGRPLTRRQALPLRQHAPRGVLRRHRLRQATSCSSPGPAARRRRP